MKKLLIGSLILLSATVAYGVNYNALNFTVKNKVAADVLVANTSATIASPTLSGTVTATAATISSPKISSPTLTGTVTASAATIASPTFSGTSTFGGAVTMSSTLGVGGASTLTGNVGIGTSPHGTYSLNMNGNIKFQTDKFVMRNASDLSVMEWFDATGITKLSAPSASGSVYLQTGSPATTRVVIDSSGNVGIGPDTTPDAFFDVQGAMNVDGAITTGSTLSVNGSLASSSKMTVRNTNTPAVGGSSVGEWIVPSVSVTSGGAFYTLGMKIGQTSSSNPIMTSNAGENNTGYYMAINADALRQGSADAGRLASLRGYYTTIGNYSNVASTATTDLVTGLEVLPYAQAGTIANLYSVRLDDVSGGGTVSGDIAKIYMDADSTALGTNKYGLYIGNQSGATNNYSIYTGTAPSVFGGAVTMSSTLAVNGASTFTTDSADTFKSTADTTAKAVNIKTSAGAGSMYVGVEGSAGGAIATGSSAYAGVISSSPSGKSLQFATTGTVRMGIDSAGAVTMSSSLGTGGNVTVGGTGKFYIATSQTPAATDACTAGQIVWDTNYVYVCTATNTWKRAALTGGY